MGHRTKTIDLKKWLEEEMGFVYSEAKRSYVHKETQVEVNGEVVSTALALANPEEIRLMVADSVEKARLRNAVV
jgi:hypothetical protein